MALSAGEPQGERLNQPSFHKGEVYEIMALDPASRDLLILILEGRLEGKPVRILFDSGANGNFVAESTLTGLNVPCTTKETPDRVRLPDKHELKSACTAVATLAMREYAEELHLHVLDFDFGVDVILGKPWLRRINPKIDWARDTMRFTFQGSTVFLCSKKDDETRDLIDSLVLNAHQLKKLMEEEEPMYLAWVTELEEEDGSSKEATTAKTVNDTFPPNWKEKVQQKLAEYPDVLPMGEDGQEFKPLFPPKRAVEHEIPLIPGAQIPNRPLYRSRKPSWRN